MQTTMFRMILAAAFFFLCLPLATQAMDIPDSEILSTAEQGLKPYVAAIPPQHLPHFGFKEKAEADVAVLGQAFHVYTAPPSAVLDDKASDLSAMAVSTTMWDFLILSGGKGVALLTVDKMGSKWVAVSIGGSGTAGQLSSLMEAWPVLKGYEYRLIRVFQASADFVEISLGGRSVGIVPLRSARIAMGLSSEFAPKELFTSEAAVKMIKPAVSTNISGNTVKAPSTSSLKAEVSHSAKASGPTVIDVPVKLQEQDNWCWDASSQCVLQFYGYYYTQCAIANFAVTGNGWGNDDCCADPSGPICNQPNYLFGFDTGSGNVNDILTHFGNIDTDTQGSALSWDDTVSQLNSGRPFIMGWGWTAGGGHDLVGYGCMVENNSPKLYYMNPWEAGYTISDFTWVQEASDHEWDQTLLMTPAPLLPDLTPFKPSGWSAPLVVTNKMGSHTDTGKITTLDDLYIDWAVINAGKPSDTKSSF